MVLILKKQKKNQLLPWFRVESWFFFCCCIRLPHAAGQWLAFNCRQPSSNMRFFFCFLFFLTQKEKEMAEMVGFEPTSR